jgi:hypothetical protein
MAFAVKAEAIFLAYTNFFIGKRASLALVDKYFTNLP